jgi:hypothetical protein
MRTWKNCARAPLVAPVLFLALLSLPGCSDVERLFGPTSGKQVAAPHRPAAPLPVPPIPPPEAAQPVVQVSSEPASRPAPAQPAIVVNGLSSPQLVKLFGEPVTRAPTGQGERWTYRSRGCSLEIFMFPDVSHGGLTALDDRVSDDTAEAGGQQACLRRLRDEHAM